MNLIGISGLAGSGKDEVAKILTGSFGFGTLSFSDPMKRFCKEVLQFTDEQLWGPSPMRNAEDERFPRYTEEEWQEVRSQDELPKGPRRLTPRYALQMLGTEWGRDCYADIWVDYALRVSKAWLENMIRYDPVNGPTWGTGGTNVSEGRVRGVVIPDVRFRNEMNAIKRAGGEVWRVKRSKTSLVGKSSLHPSETLQQDIDDKEFDSLVCNIGTLTDLEAVVKELMAKRL